MRSSDVTNSLVAADHRGLRRPARGAAKDGIVELGAYSALTALDDGGDLANLQRHALQRGSEHDHFPTVAQCVGHDLTKVPDVDTHTFDRTSGGSLMSDLGDRGADRSSCTEQA